MIVEPLDGDFFLKAENSLDRALLTSFDKSNMSSTHNLIIKGSTYNCDHRQVTAFVFGWVRKPFAPPPNVIDGKDWAEAMFSPTLIKDR